MTTSTYSIREHGKIQIKALGDLILRGTEKIEVQIDTAHASTCKVLVEEDGLRITCLSDCTLTVPSNAIITIEKVRGDAQIENLSEPLKIGNIGGDLTVQQVLQISIGNIGGDGLLRKIQTFLVIGNAGGDLVVGQTALIKAGNIGGDCKFYKIYGNIEAGHIGGDMQVLEQAGDVMAGSIGGDAELQFIIGAVKIKAGGDVTLGIRENSTEPILIKSGGDTEIYLPAKCSAQFALHSGGKEIDIQLAGKEQTIRSREYGFVSGDGALKVSVDTGGDILISDQPWQDEDFLEAFKEIDKEWAAFEQEDQPESSKTAVEIKQDVSLEGGEHVQVGEQMEKDDERVLVLRMLQEKKITMDEAEKLLEALDPETEM